MTRFAIIADTHDNLPLIRAAVAVANERGTDYLLHCGDFVSPFTARAFKGLKARFMGVFGNNDGDRPMLLKVYKEIGPIHSYPHREKIEELSILITHNPDIAEDAATMGGYDLVAYGHDHTVRVERGLTLLICPGEAGGWTTGRPTMAIVDMPEHDVEVVKLEPLAG
ncbi:MAG: metallophosphoesterase [Candidatus Coatesbacteria bacterium]|nr:MAG: metallophosphoesterase [Candidatus Coatesbacteria bacterium]